MIEIIEKNIYSRLSQNVPELNALLSAYVPGYYFMKSYKIGHFDGKVHFYNPIYKTFPTGLMNDVLKYFEEKGIEYSIVDQRKKSDLVNQESIDIDKLELEGIQLRDYQKESLNAILKKGRGVIKAATNSGKTEIGIALCKILSPLNCLWLTHTKELLFQTADRFKERTGESVALTYGGEVDFSKRIIIALIQTLSKRLNVSYVKDFLKKKIDILIIDEVHHSDSMSFHNIAMKTDAFYRIGLSATPFAKGKLPSMKIRSITGDEVLEIANEFMIDKGYSAPPIIIFETINCPQDIGNLNYQDAYEKGIVFNEERNNRILEKFAENRKKRALILVQRLDHGDILSEKIKIPFVHGEVDQDKRREIYKKFKKGALRHLIASTIYDEGVDYAGIEVLILAGGGKSEVRSIQRIGRGMRKMQGKNNVIVYDFIDNTNMYLLKHSLERLRTYSKEGFMVKRGIDRND